MPVKPGPGGPRRPPRGPPRGCVRRGRGGLPAAEEGGRSGGEGGQHHVPHRRGRRRAARPGQVRRELPGPGGGHATSFERQPESGQDGIGIRNLYMCWHF